MSTAFEELVERARPWAAQCGNLDAFATQCAQEVERSGEPIFFLTTQKPAETGRFPAGLEMWSHDEARREHFMVAEFPISRPGYNSNPFGFRGNHLLISLLEMAKEKVQALVPEGVKIVTSKTAWSEAIHSADYAALKAQRALARALPAPAERPRAPSRSRL